MHFKLCLNIKIIKKFSILSDEQLDVVVTGGQSVDPNALKSRLKACYFVRKKLCKENDES